MPVGSQGTRFYISPAAGGSPTVEIEGLTDIPEVGIKRKSIDVTSLKDTYARNFKGLRNGGSLSLAGQYLPDDPGQQLLSQAVDSDENWGFRVEFSDSAGSNGTMFDFSAKVGSFTVASGKVDSVSTMKSDLYVDGGYNVTAAA